MKIQRLLAHSTTALFLATASVAQTAPDATTVLATVNGTEITLGHVISLTSRLPEQYKQIPDAQLFEGVLDQLIQQTALGADQPKDTLLVRLSAENETRALLASQVLEAIEATATTDEKVQAAFDAQIATMPTELEYSVAHILVETEDEAKELVTALEGGADFGELAKEKSTGPSGPRGGALGWSGLGQMVPEFEQAMVEAEVGAVSAPVQTQFGWHVLKVAETREKAKPTLEAMRAQIEDTLRKAAISAKMEQAESLANITRSDVEIDPALIRNRDLITQ